MLLPLHGNFNVVKILYQIPTAIQRLFRGVVWRLPLKERCVALTFDDGCIPQVTPQVLDILKKYGVSATFFCVGDNIHKYPELFCRILNEGHCVGNHSFHHLPGLKTKTQTYLRDVSLTDEYIERYLPDKKQNPMLFRPPYGRMRLSQKRLIEHSHNIVLWDVLTHDYNKCYSAERILCIVKRCVRNGSIIVFHDSLKSNERMLEALPKVIEYLKEEGYSFLALDDERLK